MKESLYSHFPFLLLYCSLFRLCAMKTLFKPYLANVLIFKYYNVLVDIPSGHISCTEKKCINPHINIYVYTVFFQ